MFFKLGLGVVELKSFEHYQKEHTRNARGLDDSIVM